EDRHGGPARRRRGERRGFRRGVVRVAAGELGHPVGAGQGQHRERGWPAARRAADPRPDRVALARWDHGACARGDAARRTSVRLQPPAPGDVVFVDFFIRRPVLSAVLSMLTVIAGALAIPSLPIARYPTLAAPQIVVNSVYIGASSQVVEAAVTTPLEVAING